MARSGNVNLNVNMNVRGSNAAAGAGANVAASLKRTAETGRQAQVAMTDFSRVVSDAPYGINAVRNNLEQLILSVGRTKQAAGSGKAAIGAFMGAFTGVGGAIAIFSVAAITLEKLGPKLAEAFKSEHKKLIEDITEATEELKENLESIEKAASDASRRFAELAQYGRELSKEERQIEDLSAKHAANLAQIAEIEKELADTQVIGAKYGAQATGEAGLRRKEMESLRDALIEQNNEFEKQIGFLSQTISSGAAGDALADFLKPKKAVKASQARKKAIEEETVSLREYARALAQASQAAFTADRGRPEADPFNQGPGERVINPNAQREHEEWIENRRRAVEIEDKYNAALEISVDYEKQRAAAAILSGILFEKSGRQIIKIITIEIAKLLIEIQLLKRRNKLMKDAALTGATAGAGGLLSAGLGVFGLLLGGRASGGSINRGGLYLTGERGPEIVSLPTGSHVYSNQQSRDMLAGAGMKMDIYLDGDKIGEARQNHNAKVQRTNSGILF